MVAGEDHRPGTVPEARPLHRSGPEAQLRRTLLIAKVEETDEGLRAAIAFRDAADDIAGSQPTLPIDEARQQVRDTVLRSEIVPARPKEKKQLDRILDAFVEPLGDKAASLLTAYDSRIAARIIALIREAYNKHKSKPDFDSEVVITAPFRTRVGKDNPSEDRRGSFRKGQAYTGWKRSLYAQDWFDSEPERAVALILDKDKHINQWVRLQRGDLPITWTGTGSNYNPDFIALDTDGHHWIIEVKADKDLDSDPTVGKAEAAREAVNHFNADENVDGAWQYLLIGETDVKQARESWKALKGLGE